MALTALERVFRESGARIIGALAARFRDLDIAEDAFADACTLGAGLWPTEGAPADPAAWLYRAACRRALDSIRRRNTRARHPPETPPSAPSVEDELMDGTLLIPDERLRLIFICCHPAVAPESRVALTLRLVCGLSIAEIARAFLVTESTLARRLVRAKRKITQAGVPFEVPRPEAWPERLAAVLSTLEVAYSKAHEDAAGAGVHAGYAAGMLELTRVLMELLPDEPEAFALAALVRFAEARRPARVAQSEVGGPEMMVPLSEQDPAQWSQSLIRQGQRCLSRALLLGPQRGRTIHAAIHGTWCDRGSLSDPAPWSQILALYDLLLLQRPDDPVVRLNRAVALSEVAGAHVALAEVRALDTPAMRNFLPWQALRADLLRRLGCLAEAGEAYDTALSLGPAPAERRWLEARKHRAQMT